MLKLHVSVCIAEINVLGLLLPENSDVPIEDEMQQMVCC